MHCCRLSYYFIFILSFVICSYLNAVNPGGCVGMKMTLANSPFPTDRGLDKYMEVLGLLFRSTVEGLGCGDYWIDLGAGESIAQKVYLTSTSPDHIYLPPQNSRATAIAVGYEHPIVITRPDLTTEIDSLVKSSNRDVYRELFGRMFEEIPTIEIKNMLKEKEDLTSPSRVVVTSVAGVMTYTYDLRLSLLKALEILPSQSLLFIFVGQKTFQIVDINNKPIVDDAADKLRQEFFSSIKGSELLEYSQVNYTGLKHPSNFIRIVLQRNDDPIQISPIELVNYIPGVPPRRIFRMNN